MFTSVTAFFTALSEAFKSFTCSKERQSETQLLKIGKKKQLAIDYAEKIIFMADKTELKDNKTYIKYRKKFFKYNN